MKTADICARLVELQAQRRALIRLEVSIANRRGSLVRRSLGFRIDLPEAEREVIRKHSDRLTKTVLAGQTAAEASFGIAGFILAVEGTFAPIAAHREWTEDQMRTLAQQLPVWPWVKKIAGVGPLGLAVIVGETGDGGNIGVYRSVSGLWKRHGYAVIDGIRQQKRRDPDEAKAHGYDPARHAESWVFLQDIMLRAQWRAATDDEPAHALGPYGEIYALKKIAFLSRPDMTSGHADRHGRRCAAKEFLKDLYLAWRRMTPSDEIATGPRKDEAQNIGAGKGRTTSVNSKPVMATSSAASSTAGQASIEAQRMDAGSKRASGKAKPNERSPAASPRRAGSRTKPNVATRNAGEASSLEPVGPGVSDTQQKTADRTTRRRASVAPKPDGVMRGGGKK